jgi:hypothetical protein
MVPFVKKKLPAEQTFANPSETRLSPLWFTAWHPCGKIARLYNEGE